MMKKMLACAVTCLLCAVFGGNGLTKEKEKVIAFSSAEWKAVKECVDTNGYCRIASQNAMIVITNGLPNINVIHWFPAGGANEKKKDKRRKDEPTPYSGQ